MTRVLEADLTWTGAGFEPGVRVEVDDSGRIAAVGTAAAPANRLRGQALLPGFVNAHSHSFQRGLRGLGERFPEGTGSFWTWRREMYDLIARLDAESLLPLARQAFQEMRAAGITSVGEFHYLHHSPSGPDFTLDDVVLAAAREAGIRIVLLEAYYRTGGIGRPLQGAQLRFETSSEPAYWYQMDALSERLEPATQSLGAVAHSVRAASPEEIASLYEEAQRRRLVFHMHLEEQPQEIADSIEAWGKTPMAIVTESLESCDRLTAVHCTHTDPSDMDRFVSQGGRVCICPSTEANLGDGLPDLSRFAGGTDRLCLGSDSNARIAWLEELRWLELGQRLRSGERGKLTDAEGQVARALLAHGTAGGAAALGIETGEIAPGLWADFATVDLGHPTLAGVTPDHLLDAIVFGAGNEVILATAVGGAWIEHREAHR